MLQEKTFFFNNKIPIKSIIGFGISGLLLWLTIHRSGLEFAHIKLAPLQIRYFLLAIIAFAFATWVQSIRAKLFWKNQIFTNNHINTYSSLVLGNFYNCLLPGNLGEWIRAIHFSKKNNISFQSSLGSIIAEKWIDAVIFVPIAGIIIYIKPLVKSYIIDALFLTIMIIVLLFIVFLTFQVSRKAEKKVWRFVLKYMLAGRYLLKLYKIVIGQLSHLMTSGFVIPYFILCTIIFSLNIFQFLLLLKASGIGLPLGGFYTSFLIAICIMIIVIIPSAPSNIGVLHYGIYLTLILASNQLGLSPSNSDLKSFALFSILLHLSYFCPEVILGIYFLVKERKSLFDLL